MNKFTPGPWVVFNSANVYTLLGAKNAEGECAPPNDGWLIADCDSCDLNLDELRANARLIAAAPDLLEALEAISGQLAIDGFESGTTYGPLCISALAAIARARGEA